jgi:preprotein translocase subunit SecF
VSDIEELDAVVDQTDRPLASTAKHGLGHRLYHGETTFDFVRKRWIGYLISGVLIALSLGSLLFRGLNLGIDFNGGVSWKVPQNGLSTSQAADVLTANGISSRDLKIQVLSIGSGEFSAPATTTPSTTESTVNTAPVTTTVTTDTTAPAAVRTDNGKTLQIQAPVLPQATRDKIRADLAKAAGVSTSEVNEDVVSATWGGEVTRKALISLLVFFLFLSVYIWIRFEWKMAVAAIVAVIHDVFISVGIYSIFGFPVSPATVIAFLTILGFSLYDTIVVFDKVLDNTKKFSTRVSYADIVNLSMNQVLMRSLNTSIAAILPVLSILVIGSLALGAIALQDFALALLIGLLTGSYSSIFIATPVLAWLKEREPRYNALKDRHASPAEIARMRIGEGPTATRVRRATSAAGVVSSTDGLVRTLDPAAALTHPPRPRKKHRR